MANGKERMVEKTVNVPDGVFLELNAEEARVLRHVASRVRGGFEGPRGIMAGIDGALRKAGVTKPALNMHMGERSLAYYEDSAYSPTNNDEVRSPF